MEIFLLVLAAFFPIVNPPGSALVFLSLTQRASADARRFLARRVAINSFFVMSGSLLLGTFVLTIYGISLPVVRVAGGIVIAVAGWKLLNEGSQKEAGAARFDVYQQTNRPNHFTVVEVWKDQAAMDAHAVAAHTKEFRQKLGPMLGALYDDRLFKAIN